MALYIFKNWAQIVYQLSHEICHYTLYRQKINKTFFLNWFEEIISEAMSLYMLKLAKDHWQNCLLYKNDPKYWFFFGTYLVDTKKETGTAHFSQIKSIEELRLYDENCQNKREGHRHQRNELYEAIKQCHGEVGFLQYYSNNPLLQSLSCNENQMTSLDISQNPALTTLYCSTNQFTSLDVSNNPLLQSLSCNENQMTTLDVSKNAALEYFNCGNNQLQSLNISNNPLLSSLYCNNNQLTALDVSSNAALQYFNCASNQLQSLNVLNSPNLTSLDCYNNQLALLDVSHNEAMQKLACYNNQLTTLDVSQNKALTRLVCDKNQLTSLDVSNNTLLTNLTCYTNKLTNLDVSNNPALKEIRCFENQLTSLEVSNNPALEYLNCKHNELTQLNVSSNPLLTELLCYNNQLTTLDLTHNTTLKKLQCGSSQLTSLDVSNNTALTYLDCGSAKLASLNVSNNTALDSLYCGGNQLTSLDVSRNTALAVLDCCWNQLTSLDVSKNTVLTSIRCDSNQLSSLDLSKNPLLTQASITKQACGTLFISNTSGACEVDLKQLPQTNLMDMSCINMTDGGVLDSSSGIVSYSSLPSYDFYIRSFYITYDYDTKNPGGGETLMPVTVDVSAPAMNYTAAPVEVGETVCNFSALLVDGFIFKIRAYRGKVVIVNVYSTSCPYCQKEVPDLQTLSENYPDTLVVLGVNYGGTPETILDFASTFQLTYSLAVDLDTFLSKNVFLPTGLPYTIVIDRNGMVTKMQSGVSSGTSMYSYLKKWYLAALANAYIPEPDPGDANSDGTTDIMDLVSIVDYIVNGNEPASMAGADANWDGEVDIMDLVFIINLIVNPPVSSGVCVDAVPGDTFSVEVPFSSSVPITALELVYTLSPGLTFVNAECSSMIGAGGETNAVFANVGGGVTSGTVTLEVALNDCVTADQSINVVAVTGANTPGIRSVGTPQTYVIDVNASDLAILTQPVDTTVSVGDTATFVVDATGPEPLTYQWYVNTNTGIGWMAIASATGDTYTQSPAVISDNGFRYFCRIRAGEPYLDSEVAALTVVASPQTGDSSYPHWMIVLMLLAGVGLAVLWLFKMRCLSGCVFRHSTNHPPNKT